MVEKKNKKNKWSTLKKDTNDLFTGKYKSQVFASKEEKEERRKRSTREYLEDTESNNE